MKFSAARLKRLIAVAGCGGNEKVVGNKLKHLYLLQKTQRDNKYADTHQRETGRWKSTSLLEYLWDIWSQFKPKKSHTRYNIEVMVMVSFVITPRYGKDIHRCLQMSHVAPVQSARHLDN